MALTSDAEPRSRKDRIGRTVSERIGALRHGLPPPTPEDLREVTLYLLLLPFVVAPRAVGLAACRVVARFLMRPGSQYTALLAGCLPRPIQLQLGPALPDALCVNEMLTEYDKVLVLRALLFPRWERRISVVGLNHLEAALQRGHGAILWVHPCVSSHLLVKSAMYRAGFPLVHLSRPGHGFASGSAFGKRLASPLLRRAEDRYLAERVVIEGGHTIGALRQLRRQLNANRVVSITVAVTASRVDEILCLGGRLRLPSGPPELAAATGAALLPVFTTGSDSAAQVIIGPPLPINGGTSGAGAIGEYQRAAASWLEQQALAHPADWVGWRLQQYLQP